MSNGIKFEYTSQKSGNVVKGLHIVDGRYPWDWYAQECLRFLAVYRAFGPNMTQLLEGFVDGRQFQTTDVFGYETFNPADGQPVPMLVFKTGGDDKRALKFGANKAKAVLARIAETGIQAFVALCQDVAGDATPNNWTGKGKAKAKGDSPKGGGGGRGHSQDEDTLRAETVAANRKIAERVADMAGLPRTQPETPDTLESLVRQEQELLMQVYRLRMKMALLKSEAVAV